jgi:hypothetical protein
MRAPAQSVCEFVLHLRLLELGSREEEAEQSGTEQSETAVSAS